MEQHKERKWLFVLLIIILIGSCGSLVYNIQSHRNKEGIKFFKFFDNELSKMSTSDFNFWFENKNGNQSKELVVDLINDVIDSNNKNKDKQISIVYDEENTNDVDKIKDIRNSISNSTTEEFDITLGYDSNGFINKITIEKMDITVDDFNDQFFIHKSSSQLGASVKSTLDAVLDSNRKYENHKITVIIDSINSADSDAITNVKNSIDDFTKYNVNYSYDQAGYINQITFQR